MVETITSGGQYDEIEALIRLAIEVIEEHTNDHGLCACVWLCLPV